MKNTWNKFKGIVKDMNNEEKKIYLNELQLELMKTKTIAKQGQLNKSNMNPRLLRRQIAYLKTIMHYKGYNYHPRGA